MDIRRHAEFEVTSAKTRKLAMLNLMINALETLAGVWGCRDLKVALEDDEALICYRSCEEPPEGGYELDEAVDRGLLRHYSITSCDRGEELQRLYKKASDLFIRLATSHLTSPAVRTRAEGIEYMFIILRDGRALELEGDVNKVIIPNVKAVASAHTHPYGCMPSPHDIRTLINLLLDGGLGGGIISLDCKLFILREGPFLEEDYIALSRLRSALSSRNAKELKDFLSHGKVGKNIRVYLIR